MLKIKDNVDLKELEKFGFKIKSCFTDKYGKTMYAYGFLVASRITRELSISSGVDEVNGDEEIAKLYDIIKADLVEKVEE